MAVVNLKRNLPTPFGQYLRKLRIDRDEIMRDMANKLKLSTAYMSAVELGKTEPTNRLVTAIGILYGLNKQQVEELRMLAYTSGKTLRIDMEGRSDSDKVLIITFARKLNSLTTEQKNQIKEILDGKESDNGR